MSGTHRFGTREMSAHLWEELRQMLDTDDLALWHALNQLMISYWADVDYNGGSRAHEFYLPEALFAVGNNRAMRQLCRVFHLGLISACPSKAALGILGLMRVFLGGIRSGLSCS